MNNAEVLRGGTSLKKSIEMDFEEFCGDALGILIYRSRAQGVLPGLEGTSTGSEGSGWVWNRGFGIIDLAGGNEWLFRGGGCMRRERYIEKLEVFEEELNFIESHWICDDVAEGALSFAVGLW